MKQLRIVRQTVFSLILILVTGSFCFAADGDLDTFFNAGVVWRGGTVFDVAVQTDGKIIIGGNFTVVGGRSYNCLARLNTDGSLDTSFNIGRGANTGGQTVGCNGSVSAVAVQTDGKILVGGDFSTFGTTSPSDFRGRLARLNTDGSLDTSFIGVGPTGPSGIVDDIVVQPDGKILIASFNATQYNGTPVGRFARINTDGSLDTTFNTNLGAGFNAATKKITLQSDGKILVGGAFQTVNGTSSRGIARLETTGAVDTNFATNIGTGAGACSGCGAFGIAVQTDGKIVIGGAFTDFNGTARNMLARLDSTGTLDAAFTSPVSNNSGLETVVIQADGKIIVAGGQTLFNDGTTTRNNVVRLNPATGSIDATFSIGAGVNGGLPSIFLQTNGKILLGGGFTSINSKARLSLVRLETNGDLETNFTPVVGTTGTVSAIAVQPDNKILIGGDFYGANNALRPRLTRLNPDGTTDATFNPGAEVVLADSEVTAIAIQTDGKIIIGGTFTSYGGVAAHEGIARLNSDGSIDPTFTATTSGVNAIVVQPDGKIIIGGLFNSVNGVVNFTRIARLTTTGALDPTFTATGTGSCTCWIEALALQTDGKILAGGAFTQFNGTAGINRIVRLNPADGSTDTAFTMAGGTGFAGTVNDIDIQPADNKILVTGWFSDFNGTSRIGLARLLTTGALDGTFTVGAGFGNVTPADLALTSGGSMVVVGSFGTYQGVTRKSIVRIGSTGLIDANFNASLTESAEVVALQSSGKVIVGGGFRTYGNAQGTARIGVARLRSGTSTALFSAPFDFDGDGKTDLSIFRPAPGEWWYLRSSDGRDRTDQFGSGTDKLVPADYTGDGKTDIAFWRPANVNWYVLRSEDFTYFAFPFGNSTDILVPADYDGDGKADAAVFRESNLTWYINKSTGGTDIIGFGAAGDKPTVGDYDGDGKADIAIYRPMGAAGSEWWIRRSSDGAVPAFTFGLSTDKPVQGDYTRDGKTDIAFWRPSTGQWFVLRSQDFTFFAFPFGANGDVPVPGDYDGDGQFDAAVFRPATNTWYVNRTSAGVLIQSFGNGGDFPIPNAYVP